LVGTSGISFDPAFAHPSERAILVVKVTFMKIKSAVFEVSSPDLKTCPKSPLPEFAFIGRSNVGKSSLINMLCERRDLAKVSDAPGKTKLINFFLINGTWSLVDLPGYGYAKVGHKDRAEFNQAVADYLENRTNILRVLVLIDSRLPPQPIDLQFISWLANCSVAFALIFTKTDKLSASQVQSSIERFKQKLAEEWDDFPEMFTCSSKTKQGRQEILSYIAQTLNETNRI
jgi:GTP-binding protein